MCNQFTCLIRGKAILVCFYPLCISNVASAHPVSPQDEFTPMTNVVSVLKRNTWPGAHRGRTGGARGAHGGRDKLSSSSALGGWKRSSAMHGASWDVLKSRSVPQLPIPQEFWSVQAWEEKLPTFKTIGPPPHFPKEVGRGTCLTLALLSNVQCCPLYGCSEASTSDEHYWMFGVGLDGHGISRFHQTFIPAYNSSDC